jgi:outer membrane biosynthesis protein TonB
MRALSRFALLALIAASMTGCSLFHPQAKQQAQAPPLKTGEGQLETEEKQNQQPPPPSTLPQPTAQVTPPPLPPKKPAKVKHPKRRKPTDQNQTPAPATTPEAGNMTPVADANAPASAPPQSQTESPIGQLTTGDSATQGKTKQDTLNLISTTEQGLAGIKRTLSKEEETTVTQIHTFLKQAKQALGTGDSDGALTLATKAKLLLDELVKQ